MGYETGNAFGELLRGHRAAAGLTQEWVAARSGLSLDAVSALERGIHRRPRQRTVVLLAEALGLTSEQREALVSVTRQPTATITRSARRDQRAAAWRLYVELTTRIAVAELAPGEGLLRESLTSLHGVFGTTRAILAQFGPDVARCPESGGPSIRGIAMTMLDGVLRPFLTKWHPLLLDYESGRPAGVSTAQHERAWTRNGELRAALGQVRGDLSECAARLAAVAGVPHPEPR